MIVIIQMYALSCSQYISISCVTIIRLGFIWALGPWHSSGASQPNCAIFTVNLAIELSCLTSCISIFILLNATLLGFFSQPFDRSTSQRPPISPYHISGQTAHLMPTWMIQTCCWQYHSKAQPLDESWNLKTFREGIGVQNSEKSISVDLVNKIIYCH